MTKFSAKDALEPLTFDFRPYTDAQGEVPEPSDDLVAEFYAGLSATLKDALGVDRTKGFDLEQPEQVGKLFQSLTAEEHKLLYTAMRDLHVAVCGGTPDAEDVAALPYRLRQAFYGVVQGWLRPEASRPATDA